MSNETTKLEFFKLQLGTREYYKIRKTGLRPQTKMPGFTSSEEFRILSSVLRREDFPGKMGFSLFSLDSPYFIDEKDPRKSYFLDCLNKADGVIELRDLDVLKNGVAELFLYGGGLDQGKSHTTSIFYEEYVLFLFGILGKTLETDMSKMNSDVEKLVYTTEYLLNLETPFWQENEDSRNIPFSKSIVTHDFEAALQAIRFGAKRVNNIPHLFVKWPEVRHLTEHYPDSCYIRLFDVMIWTVDTFLSDHYESCYEYFRVYLIDIYHYLKKKKIYLPEDVQKSLYCLDAHMPLSMKE